MPIDYLFHSEKYRPEVIETLLVGEAPPPRGETYFYLPATMRRTKQIRDNRSLPATIFHHYFQELPRDEKEYVDFLLRLKAQRVFLIDIFDSPFKVRDSTEGVRQIVEAIPLLRGKMKSRNIEIKDGRITFLLARNDYRRHIRQEFPRSRTVPWVDFRTQGAIALQAIPADHAVRPRSC
jgi:hypothetical protein